MVKQTELPENFTLLLRSDVDYEHVFVEISFEGKVIALVNQEKGPEALELEINVCPENQLPQIAWNVALEDFLAVISVARERLTNEYDTAE